MVNGQRSIVNEGVGVNYVLGSRAAIGGVLARGGAAAAGNGLLTGLVAYWGLDEASGNALDKHSGGLTLTQSGTVGTAAGHVYTTARGSYSSSNYFGRASESTLNVGDIDFSVAAWVYLTANTNIYPVVGKYNAGLNQRGWMLDYDNASNRIRFVVSSNGVSVSVCSSSGAPTINDWLILQAWHDAAANKIYLQIGNGTIAEASHTGGIFSNTAALEIGRGYGLPWSGYIGPVAMWKNRTLSAADRTALYNGGAGLAYSAFS